MHIHHLLFDADGVLQSPTRDWAPALQSVLQLADAGQAHALVQDIFDAETRVLETESGFVEQLETTLGRWGRADALAQTLDVLHAIEVHDDILQVVQAARRAGLRCHIASNQQATRARVMSQRLNYARLFDREFYSCFLGAAKPQQRFFKKVVAQLGVDPREVLFLDDRAENVEAAQQAGLNAMVFVASDGALLLRRRLAAFSVYVDT